MHPWSYHITDFWNSWVNSQIEDTVQQSEQPMKPRWLLSHTLKPSPNSTQLNAPLTMESNLWSSTAIGKNSPITVFSCMQPINQATTMKISLLLTENRINQQKMESIYQIQLIYIQFHQKDWKKNKKIRTDTSSIYLMHTTNRKRTAHYHNAKILTENIEVPFCCQCYDD